MDQVETIRFDELYQRHLRLLKLQGKSRKTIDAYSRAVRRITEHFDCCPDQLTLEQREEYFSDLVESHSWSTVKIDRNGLQFFWKHVLERDWEWVNIVKAPRIRSLPDILTTTEVERLIGATRNLRYRVFLLTTYSMGLRLSETLALQVGDMDGQRKLVHIRRGKGHKDRFVPLPDLTYQALRALWCKHRNPCWLFPNAVGSPERIRSAVTHMDRGGAQAAMKAVVDQCGIKKSLGSLPSPQFRNTPARKGLEPSPYPGIARSRQPHHHGTLRSFDRHHRTECMGYHQRADQFPSRRSKEGVTMQLASILDQYHDAFQAKYASQLLPIHLRAIEAIRHCRTTEAGQLLVQCTDCGHATWRPRSCGHRSCPQCQNHETTLWLDRQQKKLLPVEYFMATFTLSYELRFLAQDHQTLVYNLLFSCAAGTLKDFGLNPGNLGADIAMTAVLHTHNRRLDYHPHVHIVVPGGGVDRLGRSGKWTHFRST